MYVCMYNVNYTINLSAKRKRYINIVNELMVGKVVYRRIISIKLKRINTIDQIKENQYYVRTSIWKWLLINEKLIT